MPIKHASARPYKLAQKKKEAAKRRKTGTSSWWDGLSVAQKKAYLVAHPNSKYGKRGSKSTRTASVKRTTKKPVVKPVPYSKMSMKELEAIAKKLNKEHRKFRKTGKLKSAESRKNSEEHKKVARALNRLYRKDDEANPGLHAWKM